MNIYNIIKKYNISKEDKEWLKKILDRLIKDDFFYLQKYRKRIEALYDTKQYEENIVEDNEAIKNYYELFSEMINHIVDTQVANTKNNLTELYNEFKETGIFESQILELLSLLITDEINSSLEIITTEKYEFTKHIKIKSKNHGDYVTRRNLKFKKVFLEDIDNQILNIKGSKNIIKLFENFIESLEYFYDIELYNKINISDFEGNNDPDFIGQLYSLLELQYTKELNVIKNFQRLELNFLIFKNNSCTRTLSYLVQDETFKALTLERMLNDLQNIKNYISTTSITEEMLEIAIDLHDKVEKNIKDVDDYIKSYSNLKNIPIFEIIEALKKIEQSGLSIEDERDIPGIIEEMTRNSQKQRKTLQSAESSKSAKQKDNSKSCDVWVKKYIKIIIVVVIVFVISVIGIIYYIKYSNNIKSN